MHPTRRALLATLAALPPAALLAQGARIEPTPACADDDPTPRQTAGPFYKPASPEQRELRRGIARGQPMDLAGHVLDTRCRPLAGVIVEIWHADDQGNYDNAGFRFRGWQRTDAAGRWAFETIATRDYPGRTAHYHFRLQRPDGRALITQIYFPDHPRNARDRMFDRRLVMRMQGGRDRGMGRFDFALPA
jgi:protocatechuate 3,4-dioxygenase beta subunit